jgi:hypothetical protein
MGNYEFGHILFPLLAGFILLAFTSFVTVLLALSTKGVIGRPCGCLLIGLS